MTDLHTHILPGLDDGARDISESVKMIAAEYADGVRKIVCSSHFSSESLSVEEFAEKREIAFEKVRKATEEILGDLSWKRGAEVYFSPRLLETEADKLCIEGTPYMLIELPTAFKPFAMRETLISLRNCGIIPLIAHVERYDYLMNDLALLYELVENGIWMQVNCQSILTPGRNRRQLFKMIRYGLIQVAATDAHGAEKRPPNMKAGLAVLRKRLGDACTDSLIENAERIFEGKDLADDQE